MHFKCFTYKHYKPSLARPGVRTPYPGDHQIYNFGKGLPALHHYAFGFFQTCAVVKKKIFENWSFWGSFAPPPGPLECKRPEIYNLCVPYPKDASYQI